MRPTFSPISPGSRCTPSRPAAIASATSALTISPAPRRTSWSIRDPIAELLRQWSSFHPEFSYLPRKFKIAVIASEHDRAAMRLHDIGIRIVERDGALGAAFYVGGGMGRTPMIAPCIRDFVPLDRLVTYAEACLRVYNRYGRRDNKYKARIKILVHELGAEEYTRQVEEEFAHLLDQGVEPPLAELERIGRYFEDPLFEDGATTEIDRSDPDFALWLDRNTIAHKAAGYVSAVISLKPVGGIPGDASAEQMRLMADLARDYSFDELRVMHTQNIVLPHVRKADLHALWTALDEAGLGSPNLDTVEDIIACPGLDYCSLANARSIPIAQRISERFAAQGKTATLGQIKLKISGCINACGHHHAGHIGILGVDRKGVENYQLLLGGSEAEDVSLAKITGPGFDEHGIVDAVETVTDRLRTRTPATANVSSTPIAGSEWIPSRRRSMAETLRYRDDDPVDHPAVTVDSFLDQSNASAVRIEPGDDARDLIPHLERVALVEVNFPAFGDGRGYSSARILARSGLRRRIARGRRCAGRPARLYAPLRLRRLRTRPAARSRRRRGRLRALARRLSARRRCAHADLGQARRHPRRMNELRAIDRLDTGPRFTEQDAIRLNRMFRGSETDEWLAAVIEGRLAGELAVVSSFGAESAVLLHLIAQVDATIPVLFLETGKHFPETLAYRDELTDRLGITRVDLYPALADLQTRDETGLRWSYDPDGCCELRKVRPLAAAHGPVRRQLHRAQGLPVEHAGQSAALRDRHVRCAGAAQDQSADRLGRGSHRGLFRRA